MDDSSWLYLGLKQHTVLVRPSLIWYTVPVRPRLIWYTVPVRPRLITVAKKSGLIQVIMYTTSKQIKLKSPSCSGFKAW